MKIISFFGRNKLLILAFLIALLLRTYNLSEIPVGLHGDEASIGYNAYSLLKTLRDQNGHFLPISIDQFGDFRPAGYHYLDIPFIALFGLNGLAVRLPSAIFGVLSVLVLYFLVQEFFENRVISILSAFLLAFLPWDINISRATSEGVVASFFVLLGLYFFIRWMKKRKTISRELGFSLLFLLLSFFFYHAHRYFVVLFFPALLLFSFNSYSPSQNKRKAAFFLYGLLLVALFFFLSIGKGTGRASEVSVLSIPGGSQQLKQAMDEEGIQNPLITRFYNNKLFYYTRFITTFYTQHLTGDFLFVNTGLPVRYKIPFTGNLYLIEAPFLLFGLAIFLVEGIKSKKYVYLIPLAWFLIAPIPAGLTWEDLPNVQRASLMIPAIVIAVAFGFYESLQLIKNNKIKKIFVVFCLLFFLQNFLYFQHNYFWRSKVHEPWHRSASEKELIDAIEMNKNKYKEIVMTTEHNNNFIFYLFYTKFDPATYQKLGSPRERDGLHFQNLLYTYNLCPLDSLAKPKKGEKPTLYVVKEDCKIPKNAQVITIIRAPDGVPFFQVIEPLAN